ncbi:MAG: enoyl-CoA hydratase/isomerase family protein [Inquilinaceae bacterium]
MTDDVLFETAGRIGLVTLNRPKALNALTLPMIDALLPRLGDWARDPAIGAVVVRGAGDRAFCAGGDLRGLYEASGILAAGGSLPADSDFFAREYRLNALIHHYPKPYVALIDGVTMGGGLGLSVHGSHRVASDRTLAAMPETAIGFFPDVGGTWFLNRCPGQVGTFAGLTGYRLGPADCLYAGLATHRVESDAIDRIVDALAAADWSGSAAASVDTVLAAHAADAEPAPLAGLREGIDRCFAHDRVDAIVDALGAEDGDWAATAAETIRRASPTSLKVTLAALRRHADLDYDRVAVAEYRMARHFLTDSDVREGIRAQIVDKDRSPKWRPPALAEVSDAMVERFFAPLDVADLDLSWTGH